MEVASGVTWCLSWWSRGREREGQRGCTEARGDARVQREAVEVRDGRGATVALGMGSILPPACQVFD